MFSLFLISFIPCYYCFYIFLEIFQTLTDVKTWKLIRVRRETCGYDIGVPRNHAQNNDKKVEPHVGDPAGKKRRSQETCWQYFNYQDCPSADGNKIVDDFTRSANGHKWVPAGGYFLKVWTSWACLVRPTIFVIVEGHRLHCWSYGVKSKSCRGKNPNVTDATVKIERSNGVGNFRQGHWREEGNKKL